MERFDKLIYDEKSYAIVELFEYEYVNYILAIQVDDDNNLLENSLIVLKKINDEFYTVTDDELEKLDDYLKTLDLKSEE